MSNLPEPEPEAEASDIYGRYLFPRERGLSVREPNTFREEELYDALGSYFANNQKGPLAKHAETILKLIKDGKYESILAPPDTLVYRGIKMQKSKLDAVMRKYGYPPIKMVKNVTVQTKLTPPTAVDIPGKLKPVGSPIQGWTTSMHVAMGFAGDTYIRTAKEDPKFPVIFVARTNAEGNRFFGGEHLTYAVDRSMIEEQEVISYGTVEIDGFLLPGLNIGDGFGYYGFYNGLEGMLVKLAKKL